MTKSFSGFPPPERPAGRRILLPALGVAAIAVLPYLIEGVLTTFIAFDDDLTIVKNSRVSGGLGMEEIRWAFTSLEHSNWFPLTWLSHMADVSLFGLDARGHHLVNVLLHGLAAALLFLALARLSGSRLPSALVAALFAVHPLHVESVAWVSERKDVLSAVFFALVLLSWERYVRRRGPARYLLVAFLLALGLMSKSMLVTLPALLLLLDWWPLGRTFGPGPASVRRLLVEKIPLLALSLASGAVTFVAQRGGGALQDVEHFSLSQRFANAGVSWAAYLFKTFWPWPLSIYYPHPGSHPAAKTAAAFGLMIVLSVIVLLLRRRRPWLAVGWLWFSGMLLPVIGIVQVGAQAMADRYTYLPLTGVFIMLAWTAAGYAPVRCRPLLPAAGALILLALLAGLTAFQVRFWRDSITLFTHTLAVTRANWVIHNNLGSVLEASGRLVEATNHFQEALRIRPAFAEAHYNLGTARARMGDYEQAADHLRQALHLRPGYSEAGYNLGKLLDVMKRPEEAVAVLQETLRLRPDYPKAHGLLGDVLRRLGRDEEAAVHRRESRRIVRNGN